MICGREICPPLLAASIAFAGDPRIVTGRVVGISDGDTITVLDTDQRQHKIRLSGIDAPEKGQAFGERSRQSLAHMAHGKDARIECHKIDRFGREVCQVWVQPLDCPSCGRTLDVGLAQISVGLAWWYRRYAGEQSAEDRGRYKSEEEEARLRKRGLWVDEAPVPPWGVAEARSGEARSGRSRSGMSRDTARRWKRSSDGSAEAR